MGFAKGAVAWSPACTATMRIDHTLCTRGRTLARAGMDRFRPHGRARRCPRACFAGHGARRPGRAAVAKELGAERGLEFYMQRVACRVFKVYCSRSFPERVSAGAELQAPCSADLLAKCRTNRNRLVRHFAEEWGQGARAVSVFLLAFSALHGGHVGRFGPGGAPVCFKGWIAFQPFHPCVGIGGPGGVL